MQVKGKFDLKEPYYRQLNPQPAAAWPQDQQQEQAQQPAAHQQPYAQQDGLAQMQQTPYGWAGSPGAEAMQGYHGGVQQMPRGQQTQSGPNQRGQQQMYQQQAWQ